MVNGVAVEPTYEARNSVMRVPLATPLPPGEAVVIKLDFAVTVPAAEGGNYGAFAFLKEVLALAHVYPMIAVYDDEGWNIEVAPPIGDVVYADSSFYLVRVTAPADQVVVASGIELERAEQEGRQVLTFAAGPVRDFYLAASDTYQVVSQTVGETTVNSYAPTGLEAGAELVLEQAVASLDSFSRRFGVYPYTEFDLVSTTTFALGVEYPGIVAILVDLYGPDASAPLRESVVAHEVAHQWFYGLVGNDQVDEPWLDEALAQYLTVLYYADVYGPDRATGFRQSLEGRWARVNEADIPIGLPVADYTSQEYGAIVYGRGPLFIEALAEEMGPEPFAAFLRDYYQIYHWHIATGSDFKALAEQHCNCDLTALFEEWVYGEVSN
jgi:aminopeptidase N